MLLLIERANEADQAMNQKTVRVFRSHEMEKQVIHFITFVRQAKMPVNTNIIIKGALSIRKQLLNEQCTTGIYGTLEKFSASRGWVNKSEKHHGFEVSGTTRGGFQCNR